MLYTSNAGSPAQPLKALHYKHYVQKQLVLLQQEILTNALCIASEGPVLVKNNTITRDNQSFEIIYI